MPRRPLMLAILALLAGAALLGAVRIAELLIRPAQLAVGAPPDGLDASEVVLHTADGLRVAGWLCRGTPGAGAVLLLHGVRASRLVLVDRARFLKRLGYTVLLIDLPAHGQSDGTHITYGLGEAQAVRSALDFLARELPAEKVGVIAISLGAAAVVLAEPQPAPAALVLESMFPTIRDALANRLRARLGALAPPLVPFLLAWFGWRLGVAPARLAPIEKMASIHTPVLIASGTADLYTTPAETERIYDAANEPKSLWLVAGAAHVDLHAHDPRQYESRIASFLERYLRDHAQ